MVTLDQLTDIIVNAEFKLDQYIKVICSLTDEEIAVVGGKTWQSPESVDYNL